MEKGIRIVAQCYEIGTGKIVEESILKDDPLTKAETLHQLGYRHVDQIEFLEKKMNNPAASSGVSNSEQPQLPVFM